jgi:hypothetical protein
VLMAAMAVLAPLRRRARPRRRMGPGPHPTT